MQQNGRWCKGYWHPFSFLAFAISLCLVINYLLNGVGLAAATLSVVIKTSLLYAIMITGAIWEKVVFGRYLFAPAFFWEDVVSMLVMALHTAYVVDVVSRLGNTHRANVGSTGGLRDLRRQRAAVPVEVPSRKNHER